MFFSDKWFTHGWTSMVNAMLDLMSFVQKYIKGFINTELLCGTFKSLLTP